MIEVNVQDQNMSLLCRIPSILRARDFRLYTQGGQRLVDLWQCGGAAILGHTPPGVLREFKNTAERGLFTAFPHPLGNRFTKAISRLFPGKLFRVYLDEASLCRALTEAGIHTAAHFPDPALSKPADPDLAPPTLSLWRPFLNHESLSPSSSSEELSIPRADPSPSLLIPVLPCALAPKVLVIPEPLAARYPFPPSDILSPVILAAATKSIYGLIAATPKRGKAQFSKIEEALFYSKWRRQGIYLSYSESLDEELYTRLFLYFLDRGFLLPPSRYLPLILPGILSPGEEAKLAELLKKTV